MNITFFRHSRQQDLDPRFRMSGTNPVSFSFVPSVIRDIFNRGSSVFVFRFVCEENDPGSPIKSGMTGGEESRA